MSTPSSRHMGTAEFIAFCAMLSATSAFAIDSMLPGLPEMAKELSPNAHNKVQMILTSFMLGMGLGTFLAGPVSDRFGRRPIIALGATIYCLSAFVAWWTTSLEVMLAARVMQGFGAAGPRIISMAVIRDLYSGREMARIMSFVMMVFTLAPAVGPLIGTGLIAVSGWRAIYLAFMCFSLITLLWLSFRLPETLPPEKRRSFQPRVLLAASKELFSYRSVRISIVCQAMMSGLLIAMLSMVHSLYDVTFDRAASFPYWFGLISLFAGSASLLNANIVMRFGMQNVVVVSFGAQVIFSAIMLGLSQNPPADGLYFALFLGWQTTVFFLTGLTIGNLNALAMEPVGHIAGLAASVLGGLSMICGTLLAIPVGLMFAGTPAPLAAAGVCFCSVATALLLWLRHTQKQEAEAGAQV